MSALLRGRALLGLGRHGEAALAIEAAAPNLPKDGASLRALAWAADWRDDVALALRWWDQALDLNPRDGVALLGRARTAVRAADVDGALAFAEAASRLPESAVEGAILVATIHRLRKRFAEAEEALRSAIAAHADDVILMEELAVLLAACDRNSEALEWLDRVQARTVDIPRRAATIINAAIGMRRLGHERKGLDALLENLAKVPVLNGHLEVGPALLSFGAFAEGWRQYEHRWFVAPLAEHRAALGVPQWTGQPLEGRTILVRCEQGFGDSFQFARYLPMLKARGARVLLLPVQGLERFARRFPGVDHVIELGETFPRFDYYANLMSLPLGFGTTLDTIPAGGPYLSAEKELETRWSARVRCREKPLVGLVWAGRPEHAQDRRRSLPLSALAPILAIEGIRFVSLQKGTAIVQGEAVPESVDWDPIGTEFEDFEDTAAVIANLDLLICVDTAPAHLAGAMGKDVWLLLPTPAEYRWMRERQDSPWYRTLRLFRQSVPGAWDEVVDQVASELRSWLAEYDAPLSEVRAKSVPPSNAPEEIVVRVSLARAVETRAGLMQYLPDDRTGRSLEYYGEWLQPALDAIRPYLRRGAIAVEVGSGVGAHTLPIAQAIGSHGSIIAFEDDPRYFGALELNLSAHACRHATILRGRLDNMLKGSGAQYSLDGLWLDSLDGILVQDRADAATVLAGARDTLWRCRPWFAALAEREDDLIAACEKLRDASYDVWRRRIPLFPAANFNHRPDDQFEREAMSFLFALPAEWPSVDAPLDLERWA